MEKYYRKLGEEKLALLIAELANAGREEDILRAAQDIDFRQQLYQKYKISDLQLENWANYYSSNSNGQLSLFGVIDDTNKKKQENNVFNMESWNKREIYLQRREKCISQLLKHPKIAGDMLALTYYLLCEKNLASQYPEVALEWDYELEKNTPLDYTIGASHRANWVCFHGHKFVQAINHRTSGGNGCPYCAGKKVVKGVSDLETWCRNNDMMNIIDEWDAEKNDKLPSDYMPFSNVRANWICGKGHEFTAVIADRVRFRTSCPCCKKESV